MKTTCFEISLKKMYSKIFKNLLNNINMTITQIFSQDKDIV